jgi:hypothetical protein
MAQIGSVGVAQNTPSLNSGGVYWRGTDGNIYWKTSNGTQNLGANPSAATLSTSQQIADPNPGGGQAAVATGRPSTGANAPELDTAALGATDAAINSLGTEASVGNQNIDDSLRSVMGRYDQDRSKNEGNYNDSTVTNNQNLQKNKQNALVAAAQGRRGLRGTLSALGALSGDGIILSDRAVTDAANDDIGEAADTFSGNQTSLDKAWREFDDEDKERRAEAQTSASNQRTALEGSIASKRQQLLQKKAELYSKGGRNAEAAALLGEAGGLNNEIASKSRVAATPITERSAAFTPGDLEDYLAGAGDMTVDVAAGGNGGAGAGTPSTLLAGRKDRKEKEAVAA